MRGSWGQATRILVIVTGKFVHSEIEADRARAGPRICLSVIQVSPPHTPHPRLDSMHQVLSGFESSDEWGYSVCLLQGEEAGTEDGGTSLGFSVSSPSRFSVRFKEGSVAVKVIQGPEGGGNRKLICKKKGSNAMEVTVR